MDIKRESHIRRHMNILQATTGVNSGMLQINEVLMDVLSKIYSGKSNQANKELRRLSKTVFTNTKKHSHKLFNDNRLNEKKQKELYVKINT